MGKEEIYNCVIDTVSRNEDWFYHGINTNYQIRDVFIKIYDEGLLCPFLTHSNCGGNNGPFYISLSKCIKNIENSHDSSYLTISSKSLSFIIEGLKPIKTKSCTGILDETFLPFRTSSYEDEYQQFLRVKPKFFCGIQFPLNLVIKYLNENPSCLRYLLEILAYLISIESTLPFYGFDDPYGDLYLIDKPKMKELIESSIPRLK